MKLQLRIFLIFNLIYSFCYCKIDNNQIHKQVLDNGLTVLVKPTSNQEKVSINMCYHVGSKDEENDEKGLAHLLEHTVFKGTQKLSESDIFAVTRKLSGYANAFTSYDTTTYVFELPIAYWQEALPILADCMCNCTFKTDLLNSEFKAVIQELKMYRDNNMDVLNNELMSAIFADHPYHYPIVGFKQDIWKITSEKLYKFYKKHYIPNNATLIVVGNVEPQEVFKFAQNHFGEIKPNFNYKKKQFYCNHDIVNKSVTLYREVATPIVKLAFVVPGIKEKLSFELNVISDLLTKGASSRLQSLLVNNLNLVHDIGSTISELEDHSIFSIIFAPKNLNDVDKIISKIHQEISNIISNGISKKEMKKLINQQKIEFYQFTRKNSSQASLISFSLLTGDENYMFDFFNKDIQKAENQVKEILSKYVRPSLMHKGFLLPISKEECENLKKLQQLNDQEDTQVLNSRIRESEIEPCKYANQIKIKPAKPCTFQTPKTFELTNGAKVLTYENNSSPLITVNIALKATAEYDCATLPGLYKFLTHVLTRGTQNKTYDQISDELESIGTFINCTQGNIYMTCFKEEFEKSMNLLTEILTEANFDEGEIEKVRELMHLNRTYCLEDPKFITETIMNKQIYKNHPFSKNIIGTKESINKITKDNLIDMYQKLITPQEAIIAVSGDFNDIEIEKILQKTLNKWQGPQVQEINYNQLEPINQKEINYYLNKDQVNLTYAGLSIDRLHPDYNNLMVFNQVFANKLFKIREKTGLFYAIHGTLTKDASFEPGLIFVSTLVSANNVKLTEKILNNVFENVIESLTQEDIDYAKNIILEKLINHYSDNDNIVNTLTNLETYELPYDYYNNLPNEINKITLQDVKTAAKKVLDPKKLIKIKVGRS